MFLVSKVQQLPFGHQVRAFCPPFNPFRLNKSVISQVLRTCYLPIWFQNKKCESVNEIVALNYRHLDHISSPTFSQKIVIVCMWWSRMISRVNSLFSPIIIHAFEGFFLSRSTSFFYVRGNRCEISTILDFLKPKWKIFSFFRLVPFFLYSCISHQECCNINQWFQKKKTS